MQQLSKSFGFDKIDPFKTISTHHTTDVNPTYPNSIILFFNFSLHFLIYSILSLKSTRQRRNQTDIFFILN